MTGTAPITALRALPGAQAKDHARIGCGLLLVFWEQQLLTRREGAKSYKDKLLSETTIGLVRLCHVF
jgi:hypothetical protein